MANFMLSKYDTTNYLKLLQQFYSVRITKNTSRSWEQTVQ